MRYFDFHTHAFTDSLAERAMSGLSGTSGITPATNGTVSALRELMSKRGIDCAMLLPIATKPSQQQTINDWAADIMGNGLYCCGTIHPNSPDALSELEHIRKLGLFGVKFHSEYQGFAPDEEKMFPIYQRMSELGLIAVFHAGWDPYAKGEILATPQTFAVIAEKFPNLRIVAAHLGGILLWDDVEKYLAGKFRNLWFDTGVIARYISSSQLLRIIKKHGTDRILFASDCPWDDPANETALISALPLNNAEREQIFFCNAAALLGI